MWRLWYKLFGWDYVYYNSTSLEGIRRIRISPSGRRYIKIHGEYRILENVPKTWITYLT